jgi:glycerol-3-phosphate O-acyltransferase 3/4
LNAKCFGPGYSSCASVWIITAKLLFPQFKKGSFEVGGTVYPVAIKYDPKFGDAFWNSSKYGMMAYLYMMMTSWAIVCDVWYLPPMKRGPNEDAVVFANRVKAEIARQGGLVDLMW